MEEEGLALNIIIMSPLWQVLQLCNVLGETQEVEAWFGAPLYNVW